MESEPPQGKSGVTAAVKIGGKKGKIVKLYLLPAEEYELNEAMRLGGYTARSHLVMHLLRSQQAVANWRRARAFELAKMADAAGLSLKDLELAFAELREDAQLMV